MLLGLGSETPPCRAGLRSSASCRDTNFGQLHRADFDVLILCCDTSFGGQLNIASKARTGPNDNGLKDDIAIGNFG